MEPLWCSRCKTSNGNYFSRQSSAAIRAARCHVLHWKLKAGMQSEQDPTPAGPICLQAAAGAGGGNTASSRSRDAEPCWGEIALFICTAGLITMLAKPCTISTPPQSLFPRLSILQLFFLGASSCSGDYFHMQLKAKMKWCFKLSRS